MASQAVARHDDEDAQEALGPLRPVGVIAAQLYRLGREKAPGSPILYIAATTQRAASLAEALGEMTGGGRVAHYPAWDGFEEDALPASVEIVGRRAGVLHWLTDEEASPAYVVTTAAALLRKVPPRTVMRSARLTLAKGEVIDPENVATELLRLGYWLDDRVDEPGEAAIRGKVIEIFPAAADRPCRVEYETGRVTAIRSYDPATQRSVAQADLLIVDPASEIVGKVAKVGRGDAAVAGRLAEAYDKLESLFDYLPDAVVVLEDGADRGAEALFAGAGGEGGEGKGSLARASYLDRKAWTRWVTAGADLRATGDEEDAFVPDFALERRPLAALKAFAEPLLDEGWRLSVVSADEARLESWRKRIGRSFGRPVEPAVDWEAVLEAKQGTCLTCRLILQEGFLDSAERIAVVSLRDLEGHGASTNVPRSASSILPSFDGSFAFGDAIVHLDHGVGILEGLETLEEGDNQTEALRLRYEGDASLLIPLAEIGAIWRYGAQGADVTLDRLKGEAWIKRRDKVVADIQATAARMIKLAAEKAERRTDPLIPDRAAFERFCMRFPYELTPDQAAATEAVLSDLASERPMDRLLCGDVGFGKTEVALRAAAACISAGRQVAIVAPTTVLARQHFETFRKRFETIGVEVAQLSRLVSDGEAKRVRAGLKDGTIRLVVGTHALASKGTEFADLALLVLDEEQRFGTREKEKLRKLAPSLNVLAMTATPIPRTLQAGFVGLHDLSIIATPPSRRRPVATRSIRFDDEEVARALRREKARNGQSFVVCPRIEDIEGLRERIARIAPELTLKVLHGKMDPSEVDETLIAFSRGEGDVMIATNIVESGLDLPRANTLIVWRPDRFGLAQLHQLRGRVGRGARRGVAIFATAPDEELQGEAEQRLATLERHTALGSGFDIANRDLNLRGAGELLGEEQAGHLQLIGVSLYRHALERALRIARGETLEDDWRPTVDLGITATIPADYVPEPELRIDLTAALERVGTAEELRALRRDISDRFGSLPEPMAVAFALKHLTVRCRSLDVRRLSGGPKAVAAEFTAEHADMFKEELCADTEEGLFRWADNRLVYERKTEAIKDRIEAADELLDMLG